MTTSINQPTKTWVNPRWASTPEWARPIIQSLEQFLARPVFYNGVALGDGTAPTKDPTTGVTTPPVTQPIDGGDYLPLIGPVGTLDIVDGAITTLKIALGAVDTAQIAVDAIQTSLIAAGAVTTTEIADGSISTPKLIAGSVTTTALAAGAVTATEIAANAVTATKILAGSVGTAALTANAVTAAKIAANTITAAEISTLALSVTQWVRSSNYSAGTAGWAIDGTGNAEFNAITVRNGIHTGGSYGGTLTVSGTLKFEDTLAAGSGTEPTITQSYVGATGYTLLISGGDQPTVITGGVSLSSALISTSSATFQSSSTALTIKNGSGTTKATISGAGALSAQSLTAGSLSVGSGNIDADGGTITVTGLHISILGTDYLVSIGATDSYLPGTSSGYRALRVPN